MIARLVGFLTLAAILLLLWLLPGVLFPHPGINEAIELATVRPLLYVATLVA
jgi:hypothetical protein